MVRRENPEAAFRSRSMVSEPRERYALPLITKKGRVGTSYTGGMHRGKVARKRKNMKKLRRELPPGEPVSVAVQ
ncbi:hypothetical protein Pmar_PMAR005186 [Perkinsus marinus ATCC 50983]|uniref:Uncharacterized protein n=1 Tax=Perkinsus marinus (strain ATCC 50983 / TXsc) TaxID=423536 RepID=C5KAV5_PERM5|nr:hypothetical protein Pmar_PMAR005186 [Perkinsus marinus ATCC 50983]EER18281.1 hypothetical protein Pmar_PMAR005186 [Perkinsus marinus ATCC 50983]|eukprot:XP_002786485.1 hypothetical protein Pmar_PMAR005186 [Perkinsus marinus ATCC 50983]